MTATRRSNFTKPDHVYPYLLLRYQSSQYHIMKISAAYIYLAILGATNAQEACVEGKRVNVSPGYTVEYKCGTYRLGTNYQNIQSPEECAAMCRDAVRSVCTYHPGKKICIVGDENGKEGRSQGSYYMVRVPEPEPEDPFAEPDPDDPFADTCEEREAALKMQLTQCQADLAAANNNVKPPPTSTKQCNVPMWGQNWYSVKAGVKMEDCKKLCQADAKCLSYSANNGATGNGPNNCYLYDKVTKDVPKGTYANWAQSDKDC
jgi:hypothetical protein